MDYGLLMNTVRVQTCSEDETRMVQYIKSFLNVSGIPYTVDNVGNILATKGSTDLYKCVACHMDTVHDIYDGWEVRDYNGDLCASAVIDGRRQQVGTGGDDKVGIFIALSMLNRFDNIKVAFFTQEEIGCIGSRAVDLNWFDDCSFIFQADRRGNTEVITNDHNGQLVSEQFLSLLKPHMKKFSLVEGVGSLTDVSSMKSEGLDLCVCNIFAGYYDAHSTKETISVNDVKNSLDFFISVYSDPAIVNERHTFIDDTPSYRDAWFEDDCFYGKECNEETNIYVKPGYELMYSEIIRSDVDRYFDDYFNQCLFYSEFTEDYHLVDDWCREEGIEMDEDVPFLDANQFLSDKVPCDCGDHLTINESKKKYECKSCTNVVDFKTIKNNL